VADATAGGVAAPKNPNAPPNRSVARRQKGVSDRGRRAFRGEARGSGGFFAVLAVEEEDGDEGVEENDGEGPSQGESGFHGGVGRVAAAVVPERLPDGGRCSEDLAGERLVEQGHAELALALFRRDPGDGRGGQGEGE